MECLANFLPKPPYQLVNADHLQQILKYAAGAVHSQRFDWSQVGEEIFEVYEIAMIEGQKVALTSDSRSWTRFLGRD
mgnify:CR=1 FL=1